MIFGYTFCLDCLNGCTTPSHVTITNAILPFFARHVQSEKSREQKQLKFLKRYHTIFITLHIACQVRRANMAEFASHENQSSPPSLLD